MSGIRNMGLLSSKVCSAFMVGGFCTALSLGAVAQQKSSVVHHSHKSTAQAKNQLPRSVPDSVPGRATTTTTRRNELSRIEQSGMRPAKSPSHGAGQGAHSVNHSTSIAKTHAGSAPINFPYHGPANGAAAHHNSTHPSH